MKKLELKGEPKSKPHPRRTTIVPLDVIPRGARLVLGPLHESDMLEVLRRSLDLRGVKTREMIKELAVF